MAESSNTQPASSTPQPVDTSSFIQSYKIGPVLQAKALRDQLDLARRNAERMYETVHGLPVSQGKAEDDVINVDSPTTVTHNYPPPVPSQPSTAGTLMKLLTAFAVGGPIGAGLAAIPFVQSYLSRPATVAQPTPVETPEIKPNIYGLELVPPK